MIGDFETGSKVIWFGANGETKEAEVKACKGVNAENYYQYQLVTGEIVPSYDLSDRLQILDKDPTRRGFQRTEFRDCYAQQCSIQESSIATDTCIWLGVDNTGPYIKGPQGTPNEHVGIRMHLTRGQVVDLIAMLKQEIGLEDPKLTLAKALRHFISVAQEHDEFSEDVVSLMRKYDDIPDFKDLSMAFLIALK